MDSSREEGGRAAPFAVVDRERRVSLGAESSASSGGGSEGRSSLEEESVAAVTQGSFDVSLKTMDLEPTSILSSSLAPAPSKGNSSLRKRPSALALQGSNGSSRRRLSSASSSTGSTSVAGTNQEAEDIKSPMDVDFPSSEQLSLPPQQPHTILSLPPSKKASNPGARPMALNLSSTIAPETNVVSAPASDSSSNAKSFVVPKTLLLPVGSASLGPPSALELDATLVDSGKAFLKEDDEGRGDNNEGKTTEAVSLAAEMDVDLPTTSPSSTLTLPSITKLSPAPSPSKRGLKARPSALSLFSASPIYPDSAPTSQLDLTPSPPNASIPLLLLPEGDSVSTSPSSSASSATSSNPPRSLLSLPPKPLSSSLRVKPSPLALNFSNSSTSLSVNRPNLHISPSAPNLRQASTAALTPSESWATAPPPPSSIGKGKRNAKGLSLSLGFGSASPGSSSSESGAPSSPGPSTTNTGGARFNMRPPHTSIPPQTPSSSAHFQTSFPQGPPSSSYSSSSQNIPPGQRPNLLALLPTNERDPSDHASSSNPANRPYADGPIEILPGLFIGSEENARDWQTLTSSKYNIGRVVNVAKELVGAGDEYGTAEEDQALNQLRPAVSTPNLRVASAGGVGAGGKVQEKKYTLPNERKMEYLHLPWSHGQADLVSGGEGGESGFTRAGEWVGEGLVRGEGVLVHCQCGISRSATLVIAIVMRLAAEGNMVEELGEVRGMHDAYEFVKKKSPWIGPNVSLIYQLLEWERLLAAQTSHLPQIISSNNSSDGSSVSTPMHRGFSTEVESEEDWSRRRAELEALEEAEELDRDMEERMKRSRTTSASSTVSSSSSGGAGPASVGAGGRKPFGIKRRISGSSLASGITLEEEDETGEEEGSDSSETRTPPPPLPIHHSDSDAMMVDGIVEDTTGGRSTEDMEVAGVSQKPTKFAAPPVGGRAERKRSSTLSFVPSLDPLPSSPTTITDPSPSNLSESSASLDPLTPRISLLPRSKSYQSHAQRASLSSLDEITPSSPLISSFTPTTFDQGPTRSSFTPPNFDQPPTRSETPSSMTSTSSRRSSLSSFPRPPPILSSNNEPRSLQQLLFFPPSPNRSMDPSTPTMAHSTSIFLSSPAPTQQTFASSSSSFGYQVASTSPITERTPTGVQRLRSMIPPIISPTTSSALLMDDTPLAHVFGSLGGGLGGGGFGSRHSPRQRKDLHRKTFSLDVKSLFSSSPSTNPSDPLPPSEAAGPSFSPPKRTRAPSAGILGGFVFGGGGGRHSRTPSISSVTSSQGGGGGGSTTSSRKSSVNGGGMMPTSSTPTCVVTEFNARGFVLDTREMK